MLCRGRESLGLLVISKVLKKNNEKVVKWPHPLNDYLLAHGTHCVLGSLLGLAPESWGGSPQTVSVACMLAVLKLPSQTNMWPCPPRESCCVSMNRLVGQDVPESSEGMVAMQYTG
jgi:hypothetical protein